ncbi:MAG: hypothetical protein ACREO9_11820, partial [Lysobacterales bacterium]
FDQQELQDYLVAHPEIFPDQEIYAEGIAMVAPEQIPEIAFRLSGMGYSEDDLCAVLGGNHLRVAEQCWQ